MKDKQQLWRPIKGLHNFYISNLGGEIKQVDDNGQVIALWNQSSESNYTRNDSGQWIFSITVNDVPFRGNVSKIVLLAYINNPNPQELTESLHIDGDPDNNDAANLKWASRKAISQHHRNNRDDKVERSLERIYVVGEMENLSIESFKNKSVASMSRDYFGDNISEKNSSIQKCCEYWEDKIVNGIEDDKKCRHYNHKVVNCVNGRFRFMKESTYFKLTNINQPDEDFLSEVI